MEIKNSLNTQVNAYQSKQVQSADTQTLAKEKASSTSYAKGDTVNVSSQAKVMTETFATATANSGIRQERVDALKERVSSGDYAINSKDIATKLLQSESELGLI